MRDSWHILVVGAGGNTGSHLLPHLARMQEVSRLTLVDPDVYAAGNLGVQNIEREDIGRPKAAAQADKLRRIRPDLEIASIQERLEDVPRGLLRCGLFASCLDSKAARKRLNELAWRMNIAWFDCGVLGSQDLVRVNGYVPAPGAPCLECSWDPGPHGEYASLEQEYLCGAGTASFPSMASSALGGLAASHMAIEIAKFMHGAREESLVGRQLVMNARYHGVQVTTEHKNPQCRFDHRVWVLEPWVCGLGDTSVGEALARVGCIAVEGHHFAEELICPACGIRSMLMRLNRPPARCLKCHRHMVPPDLGMLERLHTPLPAEWMRRTLAQVGLRAGDIVSNGRTHFELKEAA